MRLRQVLLSWAWLVAWHLPRPLRLRLGRWLRARARAWLCQHRWHYIGREAHTGRALWQCQKCLKVRRR